MLLLLLSKLLPLLLLLKPTCCCFKSSYRWLAILANTIDHLNLLACLSRLLGLLRRARVLVGLLAVIGPVMILTLLA